MSTYMLKCATVNKFIKILLTSKIAFKDPVQHGTSKYPSILIFYNLCINILCLFKLLSRDVW